MDKNTVTGLILIAAVFFGFMWFAPKPKVELPQNQQETADQPVAANVNAIDSLTSSEIKWLIKNIVDNGESISADDSISIRRYNNGVIDLTSDGNSVNGTVTVDNTPLEWGDIMAADLSKMTPAQQRKAIELVREASTSLGRYGMFARFLSGAHGL